MFVDCEKIAKKILKRIESGGTLVVLRNNDNPSAVSYVRQLIKLGTPKNINVIEEDYNSYTLPIHLDRAIFRYNEDEDVHGIMLVSPEKIHYPCISTITPDKLIEGNECDDKLSRVSCTARACVEIAEHEWGNIEKVDFLIIGYGKAVGKPLAYLLMRKHAGCVTTTHRYTLMEDLLDAHIPGAEIIISAVGHPHLIPARQNGILQFSEKLFIDAGISIKEGRVVGDLDPELALGNSLTPVPGGVGPVTTALLLENVSLAAQGKF